MAWKLFYDGGCNLCHASQLAAERWAKRAGQPLQVDVLLGDEALENGYGPALTLVADDRIYRAHEAWLKLATIGPWPIRTLARLGRFRPARALVAVAYRAVARVRLRVFGRRACVNPPAPTR